ncbi:hypothetical protein L9F63_018186, partial [Diploptera punctata]
FRTGRKKTVRKLAVIYTTIWFLIFGSLVISSFLLIRNDMFRDRVIFIYGYKVKMIGE